MMVQSSIRTRLAFVLILAYFRVISCKCIQSYMTICDSFDDFSKYADTENLSELMIGSARGIASMTSVNLKDAFDFLTYRKLTILFIVGAVNNLEKINYPRCMHKAIPLKYLNFYGNVLKNIEQGHFPVIEVKKLSLANNKIESIGRDAFSLLEIENLDLSDNLMEVIASGSLPLKNVTKIITIRNNKLSHIEPGSFPSSLEFLNLDRNKFRYLQDQVFENLINLRELTLSHNKLSEIPNISNLKQLVIFDISSNAISSVKAGTFKDMRKLALLDLSKNNIASDLVLESLDIPDKQPSFTISLALNNLRSINLTNFPLQKMTLVSHGNPWDCNTWSVLQRPLGEQDNECDMKFYSMESLPFCVNYIRNFEGDSWEGSVDRFRDIVMENEKKSGCVVATRRQRWLHEMNLHCFQHKHR